MTRGPNVSRERSRSDEVAPWASSISRSRGFDTLTLGFASRVLICHDRPRELFEILRSPSDLRERTFGTALAKWQSEDPTRYASIIPVGSFDSASTAHPHLARRVDSGSRRWLRRPSLHPRRR